MFIKISYGYCLKETPQDLLKRKGENSFGGDRLTFKSSDSFRRYREEREYIDKDVS